MIRKLLLAGVALVATPAFADEIRITSGPVPIVVHDGDTLVTAKELVQPKDADGNLVAYQPSGAFINRVDRGGFYINAKLRLVGWVAGKGFVYAPIGAPAAPVVVPPVVITPPAPPVASNVMFGVNLSGCEFAKAEGGNLCPNAADVDWYINAGFTLIRFPVKPETPMAKIQPAIDRALELGATVVIDLHTYHWLTPSQSAAYWTRWAKYNGNMKVVYGLPNEPGWFDSTTITNDWVQWATETKQIVADFRARGVPNIISSGYPGSSGLTRFDKGETANRQCESAACGIDRAGGFKGIANLWVEAHKYYDANGAGATAKCAAYGLESGTRNPREAAAARGVTLFIGESAIGKFTQLNADTGCQKLGKDAIATLKAHPETYVGITWWGGGRAWPAGYAFAIAPKGYQNANSWFIRTLVGH